MFDYEMITQINKISKAERWPFPKTFNELKDAGVHYYEVSLVHKEITYYGDGQLLRIDEDIAIDPTAISDAFDRTAVESALRKHQQEKTHYLDFLGDIIKAGVQSYRVDMLKRTVSYFGARPIEVHVERVPNF